MDETLRAVIESIDALRARGEELEKEQHRWLAELRRISSELDDLRRRVTEHT